MRHHSRGRKLSHAAAAAVCVSSFLSTALPVGASHFRIQFEDRSADLVTRAFERGSMNGQLVDDILHSGGYRLLFDQVAFEAHPRRDAEAVATEFRQALLAAPGEGADAEFGLGGVRARPLRYREAIREFRRIAPHLQWRIIERLNEVLPSVTGVESTAYLIVGGRASGIAFSDRDDIAIRLDDFVSSRSNEILDVDRLGSVLCHELFHVGFRHAGGLPPRPKDPDPLWVALARRFGPDLVGEVWRASEMNEWDGPTVALKFASWVVPSPWDVRALDRYLSLLSRLQNEGCAMYAEAPLRDYSNTARHSSEVDTWMRRIDEDVQMLARATELLSSGSGPEDIDRIAREGFLESGPFYRIGYSMAERINRLSGRRPLLHSMESGPLEFFETYFQTHPSGPGHIDATTEAEIRRVIRAVRALGAFDPDE